MTFGPCSQVVRGFLGRRTKAANTPRNLQTESDEKPITQTEHEGSNHAGGLGGRGGAVGGGVRDAFLEAIFESGRILTTRNGAECSS